MAIDYDYDKLAKRVEFARGIAREVKRGNRCSMVLGIALNLKPRKGEVSMLDLASSTTYGAKQTVIAGVASFLGRSDHDERLLLGEQPFLANFYVRGEELAAQINAVYGPPDVTGTGADVIAKKMIENQHGVLFLEGVWQTEGGTSGNHIDLWDGTTMVIEGGHSIGAQIQEIKRARKVSFWKVTPIRPVADDFNSACPRAPLPPGS